MKLLLVFMLIIGSTAYAQQVPSAAHGTTAESSDTQKPQAETDAQKKLIAAQTKAILELSTRVTKLEERIRDLEAKNGGQNGR